MVCLLDDPIFWEIAHIAEKNYASVLILITLGFLFAIPAKCTNGNRLLYYI